MYVCMYASSIYIITMVSYSYLLELFIYAEVTYVQYVSILLIVITVSYAYILTTWPLHRAEVE